MLKCSADVRHGHIQINTHLGIVYFEVLDGIKLRVCSLAYSWSLRHSETPKYRKEPRVLTFLLALTLTKACILACEMGRGGRRDEL